MNFLVFIFDLLTGGFIKNILSRLGVYSGVVAFFFQLALFALFIFIIKILNS